MANAASTDTTAAPSSRTLALADITVLSFRRDPADRLALTKGAIFKRNTVKPEVLPWGFPAFASGTAWVKCQVGTSRRAAARGECSESQPDRDESPPN